VLPRVLTFAASVAVTFAFFINFCAAVYRCGCHSLWAGAAATCNIHHAGTKHCPWCAQNPWWALAAMIASQAAASFWPGEARWPLRLAAAVAAFPAAGGIVAAIQGYLAGYWN
jgi:hypothetical protein